MTETPEEVVTEPAAPAGHYYVTMKDRRILVKNINTAQSMLLGGLFRQIGNPRGPEDSLLLLGKLMRMVESLLPDAADLAWLENGILDGVLDVADFAIMFLPQSPENEGKPQRKAPRRGK